METILCEYCGKPLERKNAKFCSSKCSEAKKHELSYKDFLENKDVSFASKAYILASQQYMFKDIQGVGKIGYSNRQLSNKINMPESTIRKCDKELENKNYLTILKNEIRDLETGCFTNTKIL